MTAKGTAKGFACLADRDKAVEQALDIAREDARHHGQALVSRVVTFEERGDKFYCAAECDWS